MFFFDEKEKLTIPKSQYKELMETTYGAKSTAMGFSAGAQKYKLLRLHKMVTGHLLFIADDINMETILNPNAVSSRRM